MRLFISLVIFLFGIAQVFASVITTGTFIGSDEGERLGFSGNVAYVVTVDLANLVVGKAYSLQLLFAESCCTRGENV